MALSPPAAQVVLIVTDTAYGIKVFEPHTTSPYGWRQLKNGSSEFHKAGDFNYKVGPNGQSGNTLDPFDYWDQQGRVDPNPAPPVHLADHQRYLGILGSTTVNDSSAASPIGPSQTIDPADAAAEAEARNKVRVLAILNPGKANLGGHDANAPAPIPNQISSPDRSPTFAERFGSWASSPSATAPLTC
jgi:hypothetical protein